MIDVSSRRPPDRLATARAAHGELESEGVQRSWPSARPTASKTSDGGAAIKGCACWPCGEAFKAPLAVPAGPVQAKGPGCVGRRPTRQARYCSVAEPTAAERSAKQPPALEPLARPSGRATARRTRAARGSSRPSPSPTSRSRPLEVTKIAVSSRGEPSVGGGGAVRGATRPAQATTV